MPTDSPLTRKLWRASRILGCSPFDPKLLAHNHAQLDFILEMYAADTGEFTFERPGQPAAGAAETNITKIWADVLTGAALKRFLMRRMPSSEVMDRLRRMRKR